MRLLIRTPIANMPLFKATAAIILLITFLFALPSQAEQAQRNENAQKENRNKLNDVQKAIAKQKSNIFDTDKKRSSIEQQLKKDDLAIAEVTKRINKIEVDLATTLEKISALTKQKKQLSIAKQKQEKLLAKQLRTAYTAGQHNYLKLLLNQDQSEKIQRTISYYHYLNKARIKEIDKFQITIAQLLEVTTEHQTQVTRLEKIKDEQLSQNTKFRQRKAQRNTTLKKLSRSLLSSQQKLDKLKTEEGNLNQALEKLAALIKAERIKADVKLIGLKKLKRKLSWPVKGRISHHFGTQKQGYLTWKGVLIDASLSTQVHTIHNGTVLFSDWLKGYGLLTVIDHGNGYMSLYAHNQTLLKSVGDRVETGEPIALVGQSGGLEHSALYFEIRHRGKALNPKLWCK